MQRRVILGELQKITTHPTAAELYEMVQKISPIISLGTVYRNLELLVRSGVVRRLPGLGREARFDADLSQHHHLRCTKCGRIDDFKASARVTIGSYVVEQEGWKVHDHQLEFLGVCPGCGEAGASHS